jgi:WD40 repeat protein
MVISPNGLLALTSGMDGSLMLWDLETGELIRRSDGHGILFDVALSPNGQTALFGSSDTTITEWRLQNPSASELERWIEDNRYVRELACEERARYQIEPLCDDGQ